MAESSEQPKSVREQVDEIQRELEKIVQEKLVAAADAEAAAETAAVASEQEKAREAMVAASRAAQRLTRYRHALETELEEGGEPRSPLAAAAVHLAAAEELEGAVADAVDRAAQRRQTVNAIARSGASLDEARANLERVRQRNEDVSARIVRIRSRLAMPSERKRAS